MDKTFGNLLRLAMAIFLASLVSIGALAQEADGLSKLAGTWKLAGDSPYGELLHILVVAADGHATYESGGEVSEVRNLEIDGNEVRFDMTVFGGPGSYELAFAGSFDNEALTGDILSSGASFAAVRAPRSPDLGGLIGTWKLAGTSRYGPLEHELVVTTGGTATYASNGEVSEVRNLEIEGSEVRFEMTIWGGPGSYEVAFVGSFDEQMLSGDILTGGASFATMTAPRE